MRLAGIELGGTKCIVVLGEGETIVDRIVFPTLAPEDTLGPALDQIARWHDDAPVKALGVASFGPVRVNREAPDFGTLLNTPKPGWSGTRVLDMVQARFDCSLGLDTDVNAAALAEYAHGAGQGCSNLVYLTIGTGLGGGVLVEGRPVHGSLHPEIGHVRLRRVEGDDFAGVCPFHGDCIEGLIAGPALVARLPLAPADLDPDAPEWTPVGHDLAELLAQLMLTVSPERIIVGGGVANRQPHLLARAREYLPELLAGYLDLPSGPGLEQLVCPPLLGDDAGPVGALVLAAQALAETSGWR